jgi:hypothetical protein
MPTYFSRVTTTVSVVRTAIGLNLDDAIDPAFGDRSKAVT